jgi:hypothetical protein
MKLKNLVLPLAATAVATEAFAHHPSSFHSRGLSIRNYLPASLKSHDPEKSFEPSQIDKELVKLNLKELEDKLRKKYEFTKSPEGFNEDKKPFYHPINLDDGSDKIMKDALNILNSFKEESAESNREAKIFLEKYLNSNYDNLSLNEKDAIKTDYVDLLSKVNSYFDDILKKDIKLVDKKTKELKTCLGIFVKMKSVIPLYEPPKDFLEEVQFQIELLDFLHVSRGSEGVFEFKEEMVDLIKKAKEKANDSDIKTIMQKPKDKNRNNNDWIM